VSVPRIVGDGPQIESTDYVSTPSRSGMRYIASNNISISYSYDILLDCAEKSRQIHGDGVSWFFRNLPVLALIAHRSSSVRSSLLALSSSTEVIGPCSFSQSSRKTPNAAEASARADLRRPVR